jgi:predicted nucleic acid-binding protein
MRVLLDVNVILDAVLRRAPWSVEAEAILKADADGHIECAVVTHSLATVFYLSRKTIGTAAARTAVRQYLHAMEILGVDEQTLLDADAMPGADSEDNTLIAAAISAAVDAIITRNVADFAYSPIPVWEPAELLRRLAAGGSAGTGLSATPP